MNEPLEPRRLEASEVEAALTGDGESKLTDDESPNGPLSLNRCEVYQGGGYYCNPPGQVDVHGSSWHICGECAGRGRPASAKTPPRERPKGACSPRFNMRPRHRA
jgi:hypothetical protein